MHVGDAGAVYQSLLQRGVIVRPVANYGLPNSCACQSGCPAENRRFLDALAIALTR
jgi:histidinol-phosphate aminotransferase